MYYALNHLNVHIIILHIHLKRIIYNAQLILYLILSLM